MKVHGIDHISIAVRDLEAARRIWEPLLGRDGPDEVYVHDGEKIRVARYRLGGVALELMESTAPDGEVARFIERHGEGVMVLSLNVEDTAEAAAELAGCGYPVIGGLRRFRDCRFAFLHPRHMNGVLVELIDDPRCPARPRRG